MNNETDQLKKDIVSSNIELEALRGSIKYYKHHYTDMKEQRNKTAAANIVLKHENKEMKMIINECFTSDRDDMQLRKNSFVHHTVNHIYFYKSCKQSMGIVIKMIEKYLTT